MQENIGSTQDVVPDQVSNQETNPAVAETSVSALLRKIKEFAATGGNLLRAVAVDKQQREPRAMSIPVESQQPEVAVQSVVVPENKAQKEGSGRINHWLQRFFSTKKPVADSAESEKTSLSVAEQLSQLAMIIGDKQGVTSKEVR